MPIVPGGDGPDSYAIPTGAIDARQVSLDPNAGDQGAQALVGLGDKLQQAQQQTSDTVLKIQHMQNQASAMDASNQFDAAKRNLLYGPSGLYSLQGKAAIDAQPQVEEQLRSLQSQYESKLNNLDAKNIFSQVTNYQLNREQDAMAEHIAQQTIAYKNSGITGTMEASVDNAAFAYNDPNKVTSAFHTIIDGVGQIGEAQGWSPQEIQEKTLAETSQASGQILDYALAKDPAKAGGLFQEFMNEHYLTPADALTYEGKIRTAAARKITDDWVNSAINPVGATGAQAITPQQGEAQWNIESGGQQFAADGKTPLTSSKGAVGISQILPSTAPQAAKLAGLPYDPKRLETDANYNKALGTALMNHYMATNGGNWPLALAQYNAGPDGPGVAHFAQTGDPSQLPQETQTYIANIEEKAGYSQTAAAAQNLDEIGAQLPQITSRLVSQAQYAFPGVQNIGDTITQKVNARYAQLRQAQTDAQDANMDIVTNAINANHITDPSQLVALGGEVGKAASNLTSDQQQTALTLMNKNIPGNRTMDTPAAQAGVAYYTGLATTDPKAFVQTNFQSPAMLNLFTTAQRTTLINQQQDILKDVFTGPKPSDIREAVTLVAPILNSAGIYSGNSPGWLSGALGAQDRQKNQQLYTQVVGQLTQDITTFQQQNDRLPRPDELQKMAQQLILKGAVNGKSEMLFQAEQSGKIDPNFLPDIPTDDLAAINRQYYASYGRYPDQATAARIYLASQVSQEDTSNFLQQPPVPGADVASSLPGGLNFETRTAAPPAQNRSTGNKRRFGAGMH